jgi:sugar lactone lactonase YvrE
MELLVAAQNCIGESPLWCPRSQSLFWLDITGQQLWRWSSQSSAARRWALPQMAGCLAFHHQGGLVLAAQSDVFRLPDLPPGESVAETEWSSLASAPHDGRCMRFNDGRCDRQGRFLVGSLAHNPQASTEGHLYSLAPTGDLRVLLSDLFTPNGLAFSPDGRRMYLSDSHPSVRTVWAFDYDMDSGTPHGRRVFAPMTPPFGRPDGACVDVDGCYWICGNDAGEIYRFTPEGTLDMRVAVPVAKPTMCAFGGSDGRDLFVTSIRLPGAAPSALDGGVFVCRPGPQGLLEPSFGAAALISDFS